MEDAAKNFPLVRLIERPEHLRDDATPMNDVILNDVNLVEADYYLQTHSTNPLLSANIIGDAISQFLENYPMYDTLFGVTRVQARLWDQLARPVNHNPAILLRTQDLPPVYLENSCMYIFTKETLVTRHNRIGERPIMFEVEPVAASDIDQELDFKIAEFLFQETVKPI